MPLDSTPFGEYTDRSLLHECLLSPQPKHRILTLIQKLCRNPPHEPNLHPKSPSTPLASLGGTWFQTAWRAFHNPKRQTPSSASVAPLPPSGTHTTARRHARPVSTTNVLGIYRLAARPAPLGAIPVAQCYWFLGTSNRS